jgi:hypothetical protein
MTACPYCQGSGTVHAGNTTVKDQATGKVKGAHSPAGAVVASTGCQSCGGSGIYRAFTPS